MGLEELLKSLKSVEVIDKPEEILRRLDEAAKKSVVRTAGGGAHTSVKADADGRPVVRKTVSLTALETKGVPAIPQGDALKALVESRGLKWDPEYKDRLQPYWASDERVDSHGDIVRQNWKFDEYQKNSVLAYSHDWVNPPIGNALDWVVTSRTEGSYSGPALWLLTVFATADVYEFADSIFRLVRAGILKAGSVGFFSAKLITVNDEAERQRLGLGRWGYILDENHLLEFSPTPIGANSGALTAGGEMTTLARAKRNGLIFPGDINVMRDIKRRGIAETTRDAKEWKKADGAMISIARTLFPGYEYERHDDLDAPLVETEEKRVRGVVPAPAMKTIDEKIDALTTLVEETISGIAQTLSDHRTLLEDIQSELKTLQTEISGKTADGEEPNTNDGATATNARLERLMKNMDRVQVKA